MDGSAGRAFECSKSDIDAPFRAFEGCWTKPRYIPRALACSWLSSAFSPAHLLGWRTSRRLPQLCRRSRAYLAIASDVLLLVHSFRERWPELAGRTPVSGEQLEQAHRRAVELLAAVGEKANAPEAISETQLVRRQAFTLLFKAYEAARRAVQYVRSEHGDANEIAPAFYPGRAGRRGKARARASGPGDTPTTRAAPELEPTQVFRLPPG